MPVVLAAAGRPGGRRVVRCGAGGGWRDARGLRVVARLARCSRSAPAPAPALAAGQPRARHRGPRRRPRERGAVPPVGVGDRRRGPRTATASAGRERRLPRRGPGARPGAHQRAIDARGRRRGGGRAWRRAARPGDRVFIVLIGHGASATGERALQPARARPDGGGVRAARSSASRAQHGRLRQHGERERRLRGGALGQGPDRSSRRRGPTASGTRRASASSSPRRSRPTTRTATRTAACRCSRPSPGPGARVADSYKRDGQLLTEHAVLDDNGDGKGTRRARPARRRRGARPDAVPVGRRAAAPCREPRPIPSCARWWRSATRSRTRIAALKAAKDKTEPDGVRDASWKQLLIDLARVNRGDPGEAEAMKTRPRRRARRCARRRRGRRRGDPQAPPVAAGGPCGCRRSSSPPRSRARSRCCPARVGRRAVPPFMAARARPRRAAEPRARPAAVRRPVRVRAAALHRRACRRERTGRRPAFGRRGRPRPGPAVVARLPARRAQLHEDPRRDHDLEPVHRARSAARSSTSGRRTSSSSPSSYMAEAGFWTQTDEEAANLRAYLLKGGFIIFDDFRGGDWTNFEAQMKRVLPDVRMVELDISAPDLPFVLRHRDARLRAVLRPRQKPLFIGAYQDNDPNEAAAVHRELQQRRRRVLGVLGHRLDAHRPVERGVQARGQLHRLRADALGTGTRRLGRLADEDWRQQRTGESELRSCDR